MLFGSTIGLNCSQSQLSIIIEKISTDGVQMLSSTTKVYNVYKELNFGLAQKMEVITYESVS